LDHDTRKKENPEFESEESPVFSFVKDVIETIQGDFCFIINQLQKLKELREIEDSTLEMRVGK